MIRFRLRLLLLRPAHACCLFGKALALEASP
jgi:hypothetical protein